MIIKMDKDKDDDAVYHTSCTDNIRVSYNLGFSPLILVSLLSLKVFLSPLSPSTGLSEICGQKGHPENKKWLIRQDESLQEMTKKVYVFTYV